MFTTNEDRMIVQGGSKQPSSGAWIFPVHPDEKKRKSQIKELDKELEEVRQLKQELQQLKDNLTK